MNELYILLELLASFGAVLLLYRFFGVAGLFGWIAFVIIIANIQVQKTVMMFGIETTLGNVAYASLFLATDILNENHGSTVSQKSVRFGFAIFVLVNAIIIITLAYTPSVTDQMHSTMQGMFGFFPRLLIASLIAYFVSQSHDVWLFAKIKKMLPGTKYLWVRNNISTILSQIIDSVLFTCIAFLGERSFSVIFASSAITILLKVAIAFLDTPIVYLARRLKHSGLISREI